MQADAPAAPASKGMLWTGRVLSVLVTLSLFFSGTLKLMKHKTVMDEFTRFDYPESVVLGIGITEIACAVIYLIPQTAVLGAILLTGYLGGATATHVRVDDPFYSPIIMGVVLWIALWLRDARLRTLVPWRRLP